MSGPNKLEKVAVDLGPKSARLIKRATGALRSAYSFPVRSATTPAGVEQLEAASTVGAKYDTAWARDEPARIARFAFIEMLARPVMSVVATPARSGADRLDGLAGPVMFISNHHSHLDTPLLLTSIPEPWRHKVAVGAAADYFFRSRFTSALSALLIGAVPVERTKASRQSADAISRLLDNGWSVLLFPEGGRSPDGWGQDFRKGAAWLAGRAGVPVVPIHLAGTGRILRKGRLIPSPAPTRVTFGDPVRQLEDESTDQFNHRLERSVAALADETRSDWWQARLRAHSGTTPTLAGPQNAAWRRSWALPVKRTTTTRPSWPRFGG